MKFLSPDSGLMRGWNNLTDGVWINILMLVTSIPLVTVGAALTAGHDAARKTLAGEGHVTTNYFRSFKSNFVKSTVQWLIFGVALAVLSYAWVVLQIVPLLIPKFGFTIVWIMGFEWVWALQARFENSLGGTLANAFIFGVTNVASTIALAIIDVAFLGLIVGSWFYMPQGLFLLVVLGYGSVLMLHVPILEHAFAKYVNKPESDGRGDGMAKVTLQDVAKAAGVSIATASWAVNDNRNVRIPESTRRKVRKAADSLGYHHNALARGLARGCSDIIGFISDGVATSPFAGQVIQGAQDEAWRNGKILLVVNTNGKKDVERKTFAFMLEHQVEGVIYSKWVHESITPPSELDKVPAVLVNCYDERGRFPAVVPNEVQGGATATRLLLEAGHRRIAFVNAITPSPASLGRLEGYKAALAAFGIDFDSSLVVPANADQEGGYGAAEKVMATDATAVFCHNDRTALGLYDALRELGKRVPDDISVVGFDNQEMISAHMHPALTTVGLPQYELGVMGVRTLLRQCGRNEDDGDEHVVTRTFEPIFVQCPAVSRDSVKRL